MPLSAYNSHTDIRLFTAVACREMERERGIVDGFAEALEDYADGAMFEMYELMG